MRHPSGVGVTGKVSIEDSWLAICNQCSKHVPQGGGGSSTSFNTPNLKSHLRHNHRFNAVSKAPDNASAAKDGSSVKPGVKTPAGLLLIGEALEKSKKFARDDRRVKPLQI